MMLGRRSGAIFRSSSQFVGQAQCANRRLLSTALADKLDVAADQIKSFSIKGESLAGRPAYLDFQATTPLDPRVLDAMMPYLTERFGNPHSRTHAFGWESEEVRLSVFITTFHALTIHIC